MLSPEYLGDLSSPVCNCGSDCSCFWNRELWMMMHEPILQIMNSLGLCEMDAYLHYDFLLGSGSPNFSIFNWWKNCLQERVWNFLAFDIIFNIALKRLEKALGHHHRLYPVW
jgi:hypothetical protein